MGGSSSSLETRLRGGGARAHASEQGKEPMMSPFTVTAVSNKTD